MRQSAEVWRNGYYPLEDGLQFPQNGPMSKDLVLRGALPPTPRQVGQVTWQRGGSLTLPLTGARKAYETVIHQSKPGGPHLVVTQVKLGEMTLWTSRGPATVPAWLFTLEGYDTPIKQAAVSPRLPAPPIKPDNLPPRELTSVGGPVEVAPDGRSLSVYTMHGDCDDGAAVEVLETGGRVVLYAHVVGQRNVVCDAAARTIKVNVKLQRPIGDRLLLDALSGQPLPYRVDRPVGAILR